MDKSEVGGKLLDRVKGFCSGVGDDYFGVEKRHSDGLLKLSIQANQQNRLPS